LLVSEIGAQTAALEILDESGQEQRAIKLSDLREALAAVGRAADDYSTAASNLTTARKSSHDAKAELNLAREDEVAARAAHVEHRRL